MTEEEKDSLMSEIVMYVVDNYDDEWALEVQNIFRKHFQAKKAPERYIEVECIYFDWDWYVVPTSKVQKFKQYMTEAEEQWPNFDDMKFTDEFADYATGWSLDQWPKLFIKNT